MAAQSPQGLIAKVAAGTGAESFSPPWRKKDVTWFGEGFYVLRYAADEVSRYFLAGLFDVAAALPHEKTFPRAAEDKSAFFRQNKMNPWPVHLASDIDAEFWRKAVAELICRDSAEKLFDSDHLTLWKVDEVPPQLTLELSKTSLIVLDGHHSRLAQEQVGKKQIFAWAEAFYSKSLLLKPIHRAGVLRSKIATLIDERKIRKVRAASTTTVEVVFSNEKFFCEIAEPGLEASQKELLPVEKLAALFHKSGFMRTTPKIETAYDWLSSGEVDTVLLMPEITKEMVLKRAREQRPLPQKSTYFFPKIPFGLLVEDL